MEINKSFLLSSGGIARLIWLSWSNICGRLGIRVWELRLNWTRHGIQVTSDLKIDQLSMGVNLLHQFPYTWGIFFFFSICVILNWRRGFQVRDLIRISERWIFGHSHGQYYCHPSLTKPVPLRLEHDRLNQVFDVYKTHVVPFVLTLL